MLDDEARCVELTDCYNTVEHRTKSDIYSVAQQSDQDRFNSLQQLYLHGAYS